MGLAGKERNHFVSAIPEDLRLFEPTDIRLVFEYMEKTFHLHKQWFEDFKKELTKVERGISDQEFFFLYAVSNIDPSLQRLLKRKESVIYAIARYIIRNKIKEKKKQDEATKNFYRSGEWRKEK
jgi:hypothetical protein